MTEDGRRTGMAARCGRSLNLLRGWGHKDAQMDANTNSLWPDTVAGFVLRANQKQVLRCAQDDKPS